MGLDGEAATVPFVYWSKTAIAGCVWYCTVAAVYRLPRVFRSIEVKAFTASIGFELDSKQRSELQTSMLLRVPSKTTCNNDQRHPRRWIFHDKTIPLDGSPCSNGGHQFE